jgi:hypothetical protein
MKEIQPVPSTPPSFAAWCAGADENIDRGISKTDKLFKENRRLYRPNFLN